MRVALLGCNARAHNAIGNQMAEKVAFFRERGAAIQVFLEEIEALHPGVRHLTKHLPEVATSGPAWDYLANADLVIADYAQHYNLLDYLALLAGKKPRLILDYHGVTPAEHWQGPQRELLERSACMRGVVWCADLALTHTEFAKKELQRATGFAAERIVVQPYPIDSTLFRPRENAKLRRRLQLGAGPVLLYVGRLAANKRVSTLIEAVAHLPDAQALIVGDTGDVYDEEAKRCRELAERLGVTSRVRFLGQVCDQELAEMYGGADVLVIPSLHEGYCMPVLEAMASGLPVVAARSTALPETIGDAGLTFTPNNAEDLAHKVRRIVGARAGEGPARPARPLRIAVVSFRFGAEVVGGAERSLLTMARALQRGGRTVEIFTTCTRHESAWANELPAGTFHEDGFPVHRFPIDFHDQAAHHEAIQRVREADGRLDEAAEQLYLRHSIHSAKLIEALHHQRDEFDAIIVGPYLFGLTHDVAREFPNHTLLVPCFHDESFARLRCWQQTYSEVGGVLYHSPEEQEFAERELGINHPRSAQIGTWISLSQGPRTEARGISGRYVVYCGRYSREKNVPLLLNYADRYERERPGRFQFVFAGQGEVQIPKAAWAQDRGRVTEEEKHALLAHAAALVQLSHQESLSLVALEAWAQGTPVIVNENCAVLHGQVARAQGGRAVRGYESFAETLDDLWERPEAWRTFGVQGRDFVARTYGSEHAYRECLESAVASLKTPLAQIMRERGLKRAAERDRPRWRERFGQFIEQVLDAEPARRTWDIALQPQISSCRAAAGSRTILVPVWIRNQGTMPAFSEGPARTELVAEVLDAATGKPVGNPSHNALPSLLAPGQSAPAAMLVTLPPSAGDYQLALRARCPAAASQESRRELVALNLGGGDGRQHAAAPGLLRETIQAALAEIHRLQRLPDDYLDVTQGRFARWKRWLKQKLLGNFKKAYVDVLSRQQTQLNGQLLLAMQQLADYCATLEHALQEMQKPSQREIQEETSRSAPRRERT